MVTFRFIPLAALAAAAAISAGCASTTGVAQSAQPAARDCKAVAATFPNRPKKDATPAEQAEAKLALGRVTAERGGYLGIGTSTLADLNRDC